MLLRSAGYSEDERAGDVLADTISDSESLGHDGGRLSKATGLESCLQILVANHYPPYTGPDKVGLGLPPHSDQGVEFRGIVYRDYLEHQQTNKQAPFTFQNISSVTRHIESLDPCMEH
jgi:hypothetical protein